jgi:hypothetical protein
MAASVSGEERAAPAPIKSGVYRADDQEFSSTRTIVLKSGCGTIVLSSSVNVFKLNAGDRAFLFGLVDRLDEYEHERKPESEK